jgi:hypothetical protein
MQSLRFVGFASLLRLEYNNNRINERRCCETKQCTIRPALNFAALVRAIGAKFCDWAV